MERAGKTPDRWQADSNDHMLSAREDGKWCCFEYCEWCARQNGKGVVPESRVLFGLTAGHHLGTDKLIMWSAHEYKTAMEAYIKVRELVQRLIELGELDGNLIKFNNTNGEEGITRLDTYQRLKFIARSKQSGRGFSGDTNVIDETFAYTAVQHAALMPTMNARPNPQIIYTSTPPLRGDEGDVMYDLRARAEGGGDDSLGYRDWGLAGTIEHLDKIDLYDMLLAHQSNPALGIRITEETIRRLQRSMTPQDYAREILGMWPTRITGGGAIDIEKWDKLLDATSKRHGDVACAVDVSPLRDYAVISLYGTREDGKGHTQILRYHPGVNWIVEAMVEIRDSLNPLGWGMGMGTYKSLRDDLAKVGIAVPEDVKQPKRGEICVVSGSDMAAACGQALDAVKQGSFYHVGDQPLEGAVRGAKLRQVGDVIAWARKESSAEISPLVGFTTARWTYMTWLDLVTKPKPPLIPMAAYG